MNGNTGLDSDRITDLALTFTQNCAVAGVGPATVDCVGDVSLIADPDADDTGTVDLNEGFECVYTMPKLHTLGRGSADDRSQEHVPG